MQFGFRQKYSTIHALISLTEDIRKNLQEGNIDCGIFVDLQKAFDTVEHDILLATLIKKLTNINRCLTNPANRCLTDIKRYYLSYSTYPVLVILN